MFLVPLHMWFLTSARALKRFRDHDTLLRFSPSLIDLYIYHRDSVYVTETEAETDPEAPQALFSLELSRSCPLSFCLVLTSIRDQATGLNNSSLTKFTDRTLKPKKGAGTCTMIDPGHEPRRPLKDGDSSSTGRKAMSYLELHVVVLS